MDFEQAPEDELKLYFRGRCHRIKLENRKKIYDDLERVLGKQTLILFLEHSKKLLLKHYESKKIKVAGSMYWIDACFLFLHWMHNYLSFGAYERIYAIPHATVYLVVRFFINLVRKFNFRKLNNFFFKLSSNNFADTYIQAFDYKFCDEITLKMIDAGKMDKEFYGVTFGLDCTHCPIWKKHYEDEKKLYSYKLKDSGYNVLVSLLYFHIILILN